MIRNLIKFVVCKIILIFLTLSFSTCLAKENLSLNHDNVIINFQEKQITCINFDINMETNKAIAYNNVIITDAKSKMKAGLVEFDLKTKNININPDNNTTEIQVIAN